MYLKSATKFRPDKVKFPSENYACSEGCILAGPIGKAVNNKWRLKLNISLRSWQDCGVR